jgi:putative ABC transport system permease protein
MSTIDIDTLGLALSGLLVLIAGFISFSFRLKLEKKMLVASARSVIQLVAIGYVLTWIFDENRNPLVLIPLVLLMISVASRAAVSRASKTVKGAAWLTFMTLIGTALFTTITVTKVVIGVEPWYQAQYFIPLLGMVLGNGLTGISLCLDQLLNNLKDKRPLIEMELAHGATAWEASRDVFAGAVYRGMIPIINSMTVVGLVSLPGMMTGQILAGANPLQAVKYQIVVMFMICAVTSLSCIILALLVFRKLFNDKHQLMAQLIVKQKD